jgi:hypothetical protein
MTRVLLSISELSPNCDVVKRLSPHGLTVTGVEYHENQNIAVKRRESVEKP